MTVMHCINDRTPHISCELKEAAAKRHAPRESSLGDVAQYACITIGML